MALKRFEERLIKKVPIPRKRQKKLMTNLPPKRSVSHPIKGEKRM
jgi:hypothetical protein